MWIDVTWGAGGSTAETTQLLCETAMDVTGLDVLMHLTCTNVTVETTRKVLQRCKDKGLCNILALRGDPPAGMDQAWTATEGGFKHAVDLVKFIRKEFGDYFCIGVAAYPEGHVDYLGENGAIDKAAYEQDMKYFKDKVDAGADFAVTQLFYDCEIYGRFLQKCKDMGSPDSFKVYPGIMPIQNDDQAVKEYGIKLGVEMSQRCIELGAPGVHLYTLNLETSATAIVEGLGLLDCGDAAKLNKDYPWNRSTGSRGIETTRPIFWAQLQRLCRTGCLTVNSQPRINGALSTDPLFGW